MLFIIAASINIVPYYKGILFCPFIPCVRECLLVGFVLSSFSVTRSALRCLESELSFFSVPLVSDLMSRLVSHPSIRRVADVPCFRFSLPAKRNGASCSVELNGRFSPVGINSCFWMFPMGRWDDENFRFIFGCWTELVGEAVAGRYKRSEGQREVTDWILVKVSMMIHNIVVKSFWGQYLRERVYVIM